MHLTTVKIRQFLLAAKLDQELSSRSYEVLKELLYSSKVEGMGHNLSWANDLSNKILARYRRRSRENTRLGKVDLHSLGVILIDGKTYDEYLIDDGQGGRRRPIGTYAQKTTFSPQFLAYVKSVVEAIDSDSSIPKWEFKHNEIHLKRLEKEKESKKRKPSVADGAKTAFYKKAVVPTKDFFDRCKLFHGLITREEFEKRVEKRKMSPVQAKAYAETFKAMKTPVMDDLKKESFFKSYSFFISSIDKNKAIDIVVKSILNQKYAATYSEALEIFKDILQSNQCPAPT